MQWNAKDYANNSSGQSALASELISKLTIKPEYSILDIGCGDGKITHSLAELVPDGHVTGIDQSTDMIEHAKRSHQLSNIDFQCMDAAKIELNQSYDIVFSNAALHWVPDQLAVLHGIRSVLKPGGQVLIQMGGAGNAQGLIDIITACQQGPKWRHYFSDFKFPYTFPTIDQYQQWLSEAGLKAKRIDLLDRSMHYDSVEKFVGWLRSAWFPMTDPLPDQQQSQFIDEVVMAFLMEQSVQMKTLSCGPKASSAISIHIPMKRLEVEAVIS